MSFRTNLLSSVSAMIQLLYTSNLSIANDVLDQNDGLIRWGCGICNGFVDETPRYHPCRVYEMVL